MNETTGTIGEARLRMALRGLRQDIDPGRDLWPGIEARVRGLPRQSGPAASTARHAGLTRLATAASLALLVGMAWQLQPGSAAMEQAAFAARPASARGDSLVQREADSLTLQYRAALLEIAPEPVPASWRPGLEALDRSALEIRGALQDDPNSRLLLRLRDIYTRRLALARRALYV